MGTSSTNQDGSQSKSASRMAGSIDDSAKKAISDAARVAGNSLSQSRLARGSRNPTATIRPRPDRRPAHSTSPSSHGR